MSGSGEQIAQATVAFDCEQTVRRLWDYLDNELDTLELAAVDAHLAACAHCPPHFAFERRFLDAVRAARDSVADTDVHRTDVLRSRVLHMLHAAGELSSHRSAP